MSKQSLRQSMAAFALALVLAGALPLSRQACAGEVPVEAFFEKHLEPGVH